MDRDVYQFNNARGHDCLWEQPVRGGTRERIGLFVDGVHWTNAGRSS